jgi:hypothetical protein
MTLAEAASQRLKDGVSNSTLEQLWIKAALRTLSTGMLCDPDAMTLCVLTEPMQVWHNATYLGAEFLQDRIGRLRDCHYLAIATANVDWLNTLAQCWAKSPEIIGPWWPLRARGEIALCTATDVVWDAEEIDVLEEEGFLRADAPADRAWLALTKGDKVAACQAVIDYENRLSCVMRAWQQDPETGLRQALTYPGTVLRTELRALRALSMCLGQ